MFHSAQSLFAAAALTLPLVAQAPKSTQPRVPIDLVICLDTSGSMKGLLDSARQSIWSIVNDLALAEPSPHLRVALFTYGNSGHQEANGWVKLESGFTQDLDKISERLFAQTLNGGTELVGRVLQASLEQLQWSPSPDALKWILVAGNESADQDRLVAFREQCKAAIAKNIIVNAIYCRHGSDKDIPGWQEVARLADGQYTAIDQNATIVVESPHDARIAELSKNLNTTYIPLGSAGKLAWGNQSTQDFNAVRMNGQAAAQRALTKSTANYFCSWDLIDLLQAKQITLDKVETKDLPEALRELSPQDLEKHVAKLTKERQEIQKEIQVLSQKRDAFVAAERQRLAQERATSFESAIRTAIRAQARARGLEFRSSLTGEKPQQPEKSEKAAPRRHKL